jgi:hypothetical protein
MAPTGAAYNVDWHVATVSNAHAANHRGWFLTYTPFKSHVQGTIGGTLPVEGIGAVELRVKKPRRNAGSSYSVIRLEDVLYCPSAVCNQVSIWCLVATSEDYGFSLGADGGELTRAGARIGIIDCPKLPKLRLSGQTANQTSLDRDGLCVLSFTWPDEERARWEQVKADVESADPTGSPREEVPQYTDQEKQWLKTKWRGEFKFLKQHGLKIHDEDDRAEGRQIVRAMMRDDEDSDDEDSEDEWAGMISYTNGGGVKPIIPHAEGHSADYHFSQEELIWIELNFGNTASFLHSHGLKFYDDGDCLRGQRLLEGLMD